MYFNRGKENTFFSWQTVFEKQHAIENEHIHVCGNIVNILKNKGLQWHLPFFILGYILNICY